MWRLLGIAALVMGHVSTAKHIGTSEWSAEYDPPLSPRDRVARAFTTYAEDNSYNGAALGVMYGDRLVYADTRSKPDTKPGDADTMGSVYPILGLSKTLTAVGILKLAEEGVLNLDWTVFGKGGILAGLTGPDGTIPDPRVETIRVRHLLHNTGGWNENVDIAQDTAASTARRGETVDIAHELGLPDGAVPDQFDIITYALGRPLDFQPGTRARDSNLGWCVLGRVLEELTALPYEYWIQKNVLEPAGMWHTRIGPPQSQTATAPADQEDLQREQDQDAAYNHAEMVDSALGWYSNVYDVTRLFVCLFKSGVNDEFALLTPESLDQEMRRPGALYYPQSNEHWMSLGFVVARDGSFYLESSEKKSGRHVDVFLFHKQSDQYNTFKLKDEYSAFTFDYVDDSTVIFVGYTDKHHKHMRGLAKSVLGLLTPEIYLENAFLQDLGDNVQLSDKHDVIVKYQLGEHHLLAYARAMQMCGYYPTWLHGYNLAGHSYYATVFRRATQITQLYFKLHRSASRRKIVQYVEEDAREYRVSFLQSFISAAHDDQMTHIVLLTLRMDDADTADRVFDIAESYERYLTELVNRERDGYRVCVQSVERDDKELYVSYLLEKPPNGAAAESEAHSYIDMSLAELKIVTEDNAHDGYVMTYLDTFQGTANDQPRFSAEFRYKHYRQWLFQDDVSQERLRTEAGELSGHGYRPQILVAYVSNSQLHYAGLWVNDDDAITAE